VDCRMKSQPSKPELDVVLGRRCLKTATTARFGLALVAQSSNGDILTC
jgi:hypothetical protein